MLALSIKHLKKTYSNGVAALHDISLDVEEGDFFALLGANGAGKTTIIGIITWLVNKSGGNIEVFGHDIDIDFPFAKNHVGVVPQELNFNMFEKVIDIVVGQAGYYGIPRSVALPRAKEILKRVWLGDKMDSPSRTLSGGMKRRLMIARALIHEPKLLILDEPTAWVDVELRLGMWEYLQELNKKGMTIILTTHYLEEVEQLCRNMAMIKKGEIIRSDSVKNVLLSLESETYIVDTSWWYCPSSEGIQVVPRDHHTLEIRIERPNNLNHLFTHLSDNGIQVLSIRAKWSRLEELFFSEARKP